MTWAARKKIIYFFVAFGLVAIVALPLVYLFYPRSSCTDGRRNQDEEGVDCGGSCKKVCENKPSPLIVNWKRPFKVADGVYSATAYVTNPNFGIAAASVSYKFKLYDERNILVGERSGVTTIPPNGDYPVFEGLITVGNRVPAQASFEFTSLPAWINVIEQPSLQIKNKNFSDPDSLPRLSVELVNDGVSAISDISAVVIIYDSDGIAMAASETFVGTIAGESSKEILFTWPNPFPRPVGSVDIYPEFLVR